MSLIAKVLESIDFPEDELVRLLIDDTKEVFSTMVGMEDLLHLPSQIEPKTHFKNCVTAMVGMAGTFSGLVSIHTPQSLALQITSSMLGMEVSGVDDDVRDALGEIANMIAGSFKLHLSRGGADIRISTPSVVTGSEYVVAAGNAMDTITLSFSTDNDWFIVAITLQKD
jgi:chemotaxis protein CheX